MNSVVIYDSRYGNTKTLAKSIGTALQGYGRVRVLSVAEAVPESIAGADLLVVGGPTHAHGMSAPLRGFMKSLRAAPGTTAAAFDTRYRMPVLMSGSAARRIAIDLRRAGFDGVVRTQSFFVTRGAEPHLEDGETERARAWADGLAARLAADRRSVA